MHKIASFALLVLIAVNPVGCGGSASTQIDQPEGSTGVSADSTSTVQPQQDSNSRANWAAWAAIVIAIAAWLISVWQVSETRKHNRKSLLPHLRFFNSLDRTGERDFPFGLYLKNSGTGPAIIESIEFFVNSEPFRNDRGGPRWLNVWRFVGCEHVECSMVTKGEFIESRELLHLVSVEGNRPNDRQYNQVNQALKKVDIKIVYRSVYDEKKTTTLQEYMKASSE